MNHIARLHSQPNAPEPCKSDGSVSLYIGLMSGAVACSIAFILDIIHWMITKDSLIIFSLPLLFAYVFGAAILIKRSFFSAFSDPLKVISTFITIPCAGFPGTLLLFSGTIAPVFIVLSFIGVIALECYRKACIIERLAGVEDSKSLSWYLFIRACVSVPICAYLYFCRPIEEDLGRFYLFTGYGAASADIIAPIHRFLPISCIVYVMAGLSLLVPWMMGHSIKQSDPGLVQGSAEDASKSVPGQEDDAKEDPDAASRKLVTHLFHYSFAFGMFTIFVRSTLLGYYLQTATAGISTPNSTATSSIEIDNKGGN